MKDIIALGFIVSLIGATSAVAAPHASHALVADATVTSPATINVNTVGNEHNGSVNLKQNAEQTKLYVAENRPEFGSKYQRY